MPMQELECLRNLCISMVLKLLVPLSILTCLCSIICLSTVSKGSRPPSFADPASYTKFDSRSVGVSLDIHVSPSANVERREVSQILEATRSGISPLRPTWNCWSALGLECVAEAGKHPITRAILRWLESSMQWGCTEQIHSLSTIIPMSGIRWIAVLAGTMPNAIPSVPTVARTLGELGLPWKRSDFNEATWNDLLLKDEDIVYLQFQHAGVSYVHGSSKLRRPLVDVACMDSPKHLLSRSACRTLFTRMIPVGRGFSIMMRFGELLGAKGGCGTPQSARPFLSLGTPPL